MSHKMRCRKLEDADLKQAGYLSMFCVMKPQAKVVPAKKVHRKTSSKRGAVQATTGLLPAWVIGCYDGPSDGKLSAKKAYAK
jgi:hypothetical protein